ncbi:MAG: hypothetical protein O7A63_07655, partial [Acidobacteria bacterium]|nr:hypothetical protein [Acidobacteriota bacterium]
MILLDAEEDILVPLDTDEERFAVPLPTQGVDANEVLIGLWFKHRAHHERGQKEEADRQIEVALEFMRREGLRTAPEIAASFLSLGRRALDSGDYSAARENFTLATRFQPTLASAHLGLGMTLLRGDRDIGGTLGAWWVGFLNIFIDPGSLYFLSANGFLIAYISTCLGLIIALIVLCLKSMPAFFHDLQEKSYGRLSEDSARLLGWSIVAIPLLVPVSPAWAFALWASLFIVYLRPFEKGVAAAALLFLLLAGPVGVLLGWTFGTAVDPGARALIQSMRQGPDLHDES